MKTKMKRAKRKQQQRTVTDDAVRANDHIGADFAAFADLRRRMLQLWEIR